MRSIEITDKGALELADGFLRLRWRAGHTIGVDEAHGAAAAVGVLSQGISFPMLIHVGRVNFTPPARKVVLPPGTVSRIALLGSSPVDYVLALFVLRVSPLPCPVAYFTSSRKAMAWLRRDPDLTKGG
ncbi:STAS/SEC14 domain-containing protein [Arthrobacter sp. KFRI-F3372]|uniref:DUF7793 family protein n=1 Tax=Micrococcaceae TaxID=1268 RepID=UPI00278A8238|nr:MULTISPECIES: STAS/SEC14 domain-containing protein [Micrococcaceae]MDP9988993.1 hypothetical protein [Arthrobacter oryzae]MEE2523894.1 STAS/SEC14 domain-containing protein [Pseudarthrobacter sp. J47]MEE2530324.1 STAS/SEC14 domain-containing protein [Pseudarthrobacter sp. J75]WHP61061.1 STAS/SEC14 domain-containing protein [Arthrobacter sp. KFRI-F3372]